jgi:putative copper export protein
VEHSLLHALQLAGTVVAAGGALLMVVFVLPVQKGLDVTAKLTPLTGQLSSSASRWVSVGAALAATGAVLNLFVDVAELDGRTILGGVKFTTVWRFAATTTVGHLSMIRVGMLLLTAAFARVPGRMKWYLVLAGAVTAAVCESLVSHAAAQPAGRFSARVIELTHILATSFWLGILIHLLLARPAIESATDDRGIAFLGEILRRFSPIA